MSKKTKVLFYNGSLRMGGIERVLTEVLRNIDSKKIDIDLIIEDGIRSLNIFEKDIPQDIKIYYLKSEEVIKKTDFYRQRRKNIFYKIIYNLMMNYEGYLKKKNLKTIVKNNKYDVVIDFDMGLSKYIDLIESNKKIAWVHSSIENWYQKKSRVKRLGERLKKYDKIVTICDEMRKSTIKLYPFLEKKILRIYNPFSFEKIISESVKNVDKDKEEFFKEDFIVSVMRLTESSKDFETLIKAWKELEKVNFKTKLYILGEGPARKKIEEKIKFYNQENRVILLGNIANPYPWIRKAKMLIHSSKYEGFGLVLVEGLILNKIVISSNCPVGPKEILENGEIGYLYNVGDYEEIKEIVLKCTENPEVNTDLIQDRIGKYNIKNVIKEYEKLILED
ncbi:glycosyltransferase [Fusobacterium perfoetens]|uniref:glycosyltransferase n=1 Tax=Fusobacterium perfoetens TaxID=852 RepID=UPI001F325EAB|nr:glycosyltransferase [Fusobacterium perfoetens]MCF2625504.1 glycosyltransferase [Fusobacterium perfoetens]